MVPQATDNKGWDLAPAEVLPELSDFWARSGLYRTLDSGPLCKGVTISQLPVLRQLRRYSAVRL
jgi:hypothetical protein